MEVSNTKRRIDKTEFNKDISRQFVPYWNGLLHLVADLENGVLVRRYDWDNIIRECEQYEHDYLNTENFCEACIFYDIPRKLESTLQRAHEQGIYDCKQIAQDNDIVYTYCIEKQQQKRLFVMWIVLMIGLIVVAGFLLYRSNATQPVVVSPVFSSPRASPPLPATSGAPR